MNIEKIRLTWQDIEQNIDILANKIKAIMLVEKFDAVISIGRGGMIPARLLAEKFDIHTVYVVDVKAYTADDKLGEVHITDLKIDEKFNSVLVVDDCIFTGTTLDATIKMLLRVNKNLCYGVNAFLYKNNKTTYGSKLSDYNYEYAKEYDGNTTWLVFPWENI